MITEDELYEMANLSYQTTGVETVIFISAKGGAKHGCRVKVSNIPGKMAHEDTFTMTIPGLEIIGNSKLPTKTMNQLLVWCILNQQVILDHWDYKIDGAQAGNRVVHI